MRPLINATKHYVQSSITTVAMAAIGNVTHANAVAIQNVDSTAGLEVQEGCSIKAIYLEYWLTGDDGTQSSFVMSVEKRPSDAPAMTYAQSINLHTYPNKKNVLFTSQGLLPGTGDNPVNLIRQWIKIPKGKQRFGLGDRLVINFSGVSDGINYCGFSTYKEYR